MKNVVRFLGLTILTVTFLSAAQLPADKQKADLQKSDYARLCKIFQQKVVDYKKTMRHDSYAEATLKSYQKRAALFCKKK